MITGRLDARFAAVCFAVLVLVALSGARASAQVTPPSYVFTDLGLPDGTIAYGPYGGGADINNHGVIVGAWRWPVGNPDRYTHGFKWDAGVLTEITLPAAILNQEPFFTGCRPDIPDIQTASCRVSDVIPRAIDDIGRIAGTFTVRKTQCQGGTCDDAGGWSRGFVMPDGGNATIIDCPPGSGCTGGFADVWGINIAGVVTGNYATGGDGITPYRVHGFRDTTVLDYPGADKTYAQGINGAFDMDVVGYYYPQGEFQPRARGFLFTLGEWVPIDVPGSSYTVPSAINDARDIVGWYGDMEGLGHAFVWPHAPAGTPFIITDGATVMAWALGNNDAGQIVGIIPGSVPRFVLAHDSGVPSAAAFNKTSPADGATSQPATPTLSWGTSSGATSYKYCLDASINSNCDGSWTDVGNTTSVGLPALNPGTTYQWQVRAQNAAGTTNANDGVWWTFTVQLRGPASFSATATSTSQVALSWSGVVGATSYEVYRSAVNTPSTLDVTTSTTSATSTGLSANTTYLYKVRAIGSGGPSAFSAIDPATTVVFDDSNPTGVIQEVHFTQLRTAVNAMRAAAGLSAFVFTDPAPSAGTPILRQHMIDLRAALDGARFTLGLQSISYTDPLIMAGSTVVRTAHITELRAGTQ